ncbi:unnamed protein product [Phytophthora fragariaefolia]|uniref:Unnamed protein product n=1 Tax=Phytophthora fragariaefolia TaxID=1490495 RepID=A0A9W6TPP1_9STRA|nr:unnamed protein product [Phytophthora fragariaefolia]
MERSSEWSPRVRKRRPVDEGDIDTDPSWGVESVESSESSDLSWRVGGSSQSEASAIGCRPSDDHNSTLRSAPTWKRLNSTRVKLFTRTWRSTRDERSRQANVLSCYHYMCTASINFAITYRCFVFGLTKVSRTGTRLLTRSQILLRQKSPKISRTTLRR